MHQSGVIVKLIIIIDSVVNVKLSKHDIISQRSAIICQMRNCFNSKGSQCINGIYKKKKVQ